MFSWNFSSHKEHSPSWYITAIVVVLVLVIYGIIEEIYIMSVVSFLFAGVYLLIENNSAPTTRVELLERGLQVGSSFYEYTLFSRFAIITMSGVSSFIRFYPIKKISTTIDIPLAPDVVVADIREYLASILEEERNNTASNADTLIHAMKL